MHLLYSLHHHAGAGVHIENGQVRDYHIQGTGTDEEHVCNYLHPAVFQADKESVSRHGRVAGRAMRTGGTWVEQIGLGVPTRKTGQESYWY